jgi:hypothetical protein
MAYGRRRRHSFSRRCPIFGSDHRTSMRCITMPRLTLGCDACDVLHVHYSYRDPLQLCQFLLSQCLSRNVHVLHPVIVTDIITSPDNTITGLTVRSPAGSRTMRPSNTLLLTAGVWTPRVSRRFSHRYCNRLASDYTYLWPLRRLTLAALDSTRARGASDNRLPRHI